MKGQYCQSDPFISQFWPPFCSWCIVDPCTKSFLTTFFEKFVHSQLYHFVTDYNLLSSNQSGFRAMHSTQTCLLEVTDYLLDNFNCGFYTGVVFLVLKKAFDTVHHKVLLNKLQSIGVQGSELNWFESYLSNRQQVTKIGDFMPSFCKLWCPPGFNTMAPCFLLCT